MTAIYLGWDVGGWEGRADGLAALSVDADGRLASVGEAVRTGLKDLLAARRFSARELLGRCGVTARPARIVIGVDSNLGWPEAFRRHVQGGADTAAYVPDMSGEIGNDLAYRLCDRIVFERCGKKPLSASFDRLGNNATKAIIGCDLLRQADAAAVRPFDGDHGCVTAIEAYPALWKTGPRKDSGLIPEAAAALDTIDLPPAGTDEADAVLAALTAACYDNQERRLGLNLPALRTLGEYLSDAATSDRERDLIHREGWVYYPVAAEGQEP